MGGPALGIGYEEGIQTTTPGKSSGLTLRISETNDGGTERVGVDGDAMLISPGGNLVAVNGSADAGGDDGVEPM